MHYENSLKKFCLVLDFEANCSGNQKKDHEIIEFPALLIDCHKGAIVAEFQKYVQMVTHKNLSKFIKELTNITDKQVQNGEKWETVLVLFEDWCLNHGVSNTNTTVVTCGDWDLKTMLPKQMHLTKTSLSPFLSNLFSSWNNLKKCFKNYIRGHVYFYPNVPCGRLLNLDEIVANLGLDFIGHHHSGIDDCKNVCQILFYLLARGWNVTRTNYGQKLKKKLDDMPKSKESCVIENDHCLI